MKRRNAAATLLPVTFALAAACSGQSADSASGGAGSAGGPSVAYAVVDTAQSQCFSSSACGPCPGDGAAFFGQDAHYAGVEPRYVDNGDGTVTDAATGLMWQKDPGPKLSWDEALAKLESFELAGYGDWRLPTIKELYSLILFSGRDVSGCQTAEGCTLMPFIRDDVFEFSYGDTSAGERLIDSQYLSSTRYVATTMNGDETAFGVNFADGRIKGYGLTLHGAPKTFFVSYVRGNPSYGQNELVDNADGTIADVATGLTWMQTDSGGFAVGAAQDGALTWEEALSWCEGLVHAGHDDWRLPNAKELQSIVDYARSPATTGSAAIDPLFEATPIVDEGGGSNYAFYWTSTTHATTGPEDVAGGSAVYVAFGEALGFMQSPSGEWELLDVHGAGAQRSDPKTGDAASYPHGHGPQGDVVRIRNFARCVRGGAVRAAAAGSPCSGGAGGSGGTNDGGAGPAPCSSDAECQAPGACPPDAALGCGCAPTPAGAKACVPRCKTSQDCPKPPGMTLSCQSGGLCAPG